MQLTAVVAATLLAAWTWDAISIAVTGEHVPVLKMISPVVFFVGVVVTAALGTTWRWLWKRVPALGRGVFPDLNGRWDGSLVSNWIDPATNQGIPPIPTTLRVYQGLFSTVITLKTGESKSVSTRAFLERLAEISCFRVWYTYNNDPKAQVRHRSSRHEGVAFLELESGSPDQLTGRYYTDRGTMGDMTFTRATTNPDG